VTSAPRRRAPRWGLRTLGCLVLTFVAMLTAQVMGHHTLGTLGCIVLGLLGAVVCSVQGVRSLRTAEWLWRR
jgi:uncharacterized membrane protein YeaQ/YmgE (transglycosylase-associated protein family)